VALAAIVTMVSSGGCSSSDNEREARLHRLDSRDNVLRIEFDRPAKLRRVRVFDRDGKYLIQELPLAGKRRVFALPFQSRPDHRYTIELHLPRRTLRRSLHSPATTPTLTAGIEIPLGQAMIDFGEAEADEVYLPATGKVSLGLWIENRRQVEVSYELEIESSAGIRFSALDRRLSGLPKDEPARIQASGVLHYEHDDDHFVAQISLEPGVDRATLNCRLRYRKTGSQAVERHLRIRLRSIASRELAGMVVLEKLVFPADAEGDAQPAKPPDAVYLPDPVWSTVRKWLRPASRLHDEYAAYAYQALTLSNHSPAALNLVIESEVADTATGKPLLDFAPPVWKSPRESPTAEHLLRIAAGQKATARIPLYVRNSVKPGRYDRRFRVFQLGSTDPLFERTARLEVVRGKANVSAVTLACLLICPAGWFVLIYNGRRLARRIGTVGLTTLGLFTALHFLVSYGSRIGGDVLTGLLGPFAIFVSGIGNEGFTCLLTATVVMLIPFPGTVTLASLSLFLMNSTMTGQLGLIDLLFVTVSILLREAALAILGVTTFLRPAAGGLAGASTMLRMALAIGAANAASLYVQFCLVQVLYRLFFASWYVLGVSLVTGLLYGTLGALLGSRLGFELRRIAR